MVSVTFVPSTDAEVGLKVALAPAGRFTVEKFVVPLNPLKELYVKVYTAFAGLQAVSSLSVNTNAKSGSTSVKSLEFIA